MKETEVKRLNSYLHLTSKWKNSHQKPGLPPTCPILACYEPQLCAPHPQPARGTQPHKRGRSCLLPLVTSAYPRRRALQSQHSFNKHENEQDSPTTGEGYSVSSQVRWKVNNVILLCWTSGRPGVKVLLSLNFASFQMARTKSVFWGTHIWLWKRLAFLGQSVTQLSSAHSFSLSYYFKF